MPFFAPAVALLAATFFQMPATPPMKLGLWESNSKTVMVMPGMNMPPGAGSRTMKVRSCMSQETYEKDLAQQNQQRECQITNRNITSNSYSFDMSCPRNNTTGHFNMQWDGDNGHGAMHMEMNGGGHTMTMDTTMDSHYLGADCGSVKPGSPEIIR